MEIKATITVNYNLDDAEIERFKKKVLEYVEEDFEEGIEITLDDISTDEVCDLLSSSLNGIIEDHLLGYDRNSGVVIDNYFNSITLDYYGEDVCDLVQQMAEQIYNNKKEN